MRSRKAWLGTLFGLWLSLSCISAEPVDELYSFLSEKKGKAMQMKKEFHEIEYLREELLSEAIEQHRVAKHEHTELEENWPSRIAEKI